MLQSTGFHEHNSCFQLCCYWMLNCCAQPVHVLLLRRNNKKARKAPGQAKPAGQDKPPGWFELKVNTSVYVTGLPDDVTAPQIVEVRYGWEYK